MVTTKRLNIRNRIYYFWNDLINIKDFDPKLLKPDKKSSMGVNIHYIDYVTKNPLYLLIGEIEGFIEEENGSKYLNIAVTDNNNEVLKNMQKFGVELKIKLKR